MLEKTRVFAQKLKKEVLVDTEGLLKERENALLADNSIAFYF
jgi:hypothetical protein